MFVVVFPLAVLLAFGIYQPTEGFHGNIKDVDAFINASCECFFHIFCPLKKPMEIKAILNEYEPETVHLIYDFFLEAYPEEIEEFQLDYESYISDEYWREHMYHIVCEVLSDEGRGKLCAFYGNVMINHFAKMCGVDINTEKCQHLNKAALVYYEMVERYKVQCLEASVTSRSSSIFKKSFTGFRK